MKLISIAGLWAIAARIYRSLSPFKKPISPPPLPTERPSPPPPPPPPPAISAERKPLDDLTAGRMIWVEGYKAQLDQNRAERRRLERARRRKDKFVTPKGELPPPPPKVETPPREKKTDVTVLPPPAKKVHDAELVFREGHHTDETDVLFREGELYGEFYFRDTILDQLDRYFVYLRRMRARSKDEYELYRQIGAVILPYAAVPLHFASDRKIKPHEREIPEPKLPTWFNLQRPTFGCFVYGADPHTEKVELDESDPGRRGWNIWYPRFLSISKYERPPLAVEPAHGDGDVYVMSIWWDRPNDPKYRHADARHQDFAVFISRDGKKLRVLRQMSYSMVRIFSKRKNEWFKIPHHGFCIPQEYAAWAKDHECGVEKFLLSTFCSAVAHLEHAGYSMVRVTATKGSMSAVFGVNIKRMAYFFQDRDVTLTKNGIRKRVFHIVRPHERKTKSGAVAVPFHFRGERCFEWAGYHIEITVPGREYPNPNDINFGMIGDPDKREQRKLVGSAYMGKLIADRIRKAARQPAR